MNDPFRDVDTDGPWIAVSLSHIESSVVLCAVSDLAREAGGWPVDPEAIDQMARDVLKPGFRHPKLDDGREFRGDVAAELHGYADQVRRCLAANGPDAPSESQPATVA